MADRWLGEYIEKELNSKLKTQLWKILEEGFVKTNKVCGTYDIYVKGSEKILYSPFNETIISRCDSKELFGRKIKCQK